MSAAVHDYRQLCGLARAAELVGERWTLLMIRELLLGPKRFSDLSRGVSGISPAVLTQRLQNLERAGVVSRTVLPPPASVSVYELTEDGQALRQAIHELIRWGGRFLFPLRVGDKFDPSWMRIALEATARKTATPARRLLLKVEAGQSSASVAVAGGRRGTHLDTEGASTDATVEAAPDVMFALVSGTVAVEEAVKQGAAKVTGSLAAARDLPLLFDAPRRPAHVPPLDFFATVKRGPFRRRERKARQGRAARPSQR